MPCAVNIGKCFCPPPIDLDFQMTFKVTWKASMREGVWIGAASCSCSNLKQHPANVSSGLKGCHLGAAVCQSPPSGAKSMPCSLLIFLWAVLFSVRGMGQEQKRAKIWDQVSPQPNKYSRHAKKKGSYWDLKDQNVIALWVLPWLEVSLGQVLDLSTFAANENGIKTYTRCYRNAQNFQMERALCLCLSVLRPVMYWEARHAAWEARPLPCCSKALNAMPCSALLCCWLTTRYCCRGEALKQLYLSHCLSLLENVVLLLLPLLPSLLWLTSQWRDSAGFVSCHVGQLLSSTIGSKKREYGWTQESTPSCFICVGRRQDVPSPQRLTLLVTSTRSLPLYEKSTCFISLDWLELCRSCPASLWLFQG